jgi:nucleotide sugar dehydrogenase
VHVVSSPEAAELCKLLENSFRAVNISLANEFADVARSLDVDPLEIVGAAATKPFGFMPFYPGPGVGGHCIPCDPHYLRWQMRAHRIPTPVLDTAMESIARRPGRVVTRIVETLSRRAATERPPRVLVVGVAYKPNVADVRESPALEIIEGLRERGVLVDFFDPVAATVRLRDGSVLETVDVLDPSAYDLVLAHTLHDGVDHELLAKAAVVVDASYRLAHLDNRVLV